MRWWRYQDAQKMAQGDMPPRQMPGSLEGLLPVLWTLDHSTQAHLPSSMRQLGGRADTTLGNRGRWKRKWLGRVLRSAVPRCAAKLALPMVYRTIITPLSSTAHGKRRATRHGVSASGRQLAWIARCGISGTRQASSRASRRLPGNFLGPIQRNLERRLLLSRMLAATVRRALCRPGHRPSN